MKSANTSPRDSPQNRRRCSLPEANDIRESLLERLKCRVCLELMQSPVHQCSNGHSICPSCYPQYKMCPLCSADFIGTRNVFAENLMREVKFPCDFSDRGCAAKTVLSERQQHLSSCPYKFGNYQCFAGQGFHGIARCLWSSCYGGILNHVIKNHAVFVSNYDEKHLLFPINLNSDGNESLCQLIVYRGEHMFWWQRKHSSTEGKHFAVLQYISPKENSPFSFSYKMHFKPQLGTQTVTFGGDARPHTESVSKIFKQGSCIVLDLTLMKKLLRKESLFRYHLSIEN